MLLPKMALPNLPKLSVKSGTGWNWKFMGLSLVSLTNLKDPQTDGGKSHPTPHLPRHPVRVWWGGSVTSFFFHGYYTVRVDFSLVVLIDITTGFG